MSPMYRACVGGVKTYSLSNNLGRHGCDIAKFVSMIV